MNSIERKREELKKAFPAVKWRERVNKMSNEQVVAIHLNLKRQNKI